MSHSLQALVLSPDLKRRVKGIIFLGTPHQGTSFTRFGMIAGRLFALLYSDVEILRPLIEGSTTLDDLQKDFNKDFKNTICKYYFERHKMRRYLLGFIPWMREWVREMLPFHSPSPVDVILGCYGAISNSWSWSS